MTIQDKQEKRAIEWEKKNQRRVQKFAKELRDALASAPKGSSLSDWSYVYLEEICNLAKEWGI